MATTTTTIKTTIQFRRATTAEWEQYSYVIPAAGEPCFDTELGTLKIGDGVKSYGQLDSIGAVKLTSDGASIVLEDEVFKLAGFDAAKVGAYAVKGENGLEWIIPSNEQVENLEKAVSGLQTDVKGLQSDVTGVQASVKTIEEIVMPSGEGATPLLSRVQALETKMDGTGEGTVADKIDAKINEFKTIITESNETIDTFKELVTYVNNHGGEVDAIVGDITLLQQLVGEGPVQERINAAVANKVDKVEGKGLSSNDFTDTLLGKLNAIEDGAQANVIEKISIGGSVIDAVDKVVDIPVASLNGAGVVKSATGANKVNIANDGTMSVNKVSIHSVFVPIGDELILDGGSAYKADPKYPTRVGNVGYENIADAVKCADNGDVIMLQEDINMGSGDNDNLVVSAENVTIDLGGKTLTASGSNGAIKVEGGVTTLDGAGTVQGTLGSDNYSMAVWCDNGTVVINDGHYTNMTDGSARGTDLIYASGTGCIEINGGVFEAAKPEWTLNVKDADYKAGTAKIIVKGGSFKGFDPANNSAEGAGTSFVAEGYQSVLEGAYYVVKPI